MINEYQQLIVAQFWEPEAEWNIRTLEKQILFGFWGARGICIGEKEERGWVSRWGISTSKAQTWPQYSWDNTEKLTWQRQRANDRRKWSLRSNGGKGSDQSKCWMCHTDKLFGGDMTSSKGLASYQWWLWHQVVLETGNKGEFCHQYNTQAKPGVKLRFYNQITPVA